MNTSVARTLLFSMFGSGGIALIAAAIVMGIAVLMAAPGTVLATTEDPGTGTPTPIEGSPPTCADEENNNHLTEDQIAQLQEIVRPRANLSRYHEAIFVEWELVHSRYVLRNASGVYIQEVTDEWTIDHPQYVDVFPGDPITTEGAADTVNAPTHFLVQQSTDGGSTWTDGIRVENDADRYVRSATLETLSETETDANGNPVRVPTDIDIDEPFKLDIAKFGGRQLSTYDTSIVWPPRYPGHTYQYRVVVHYNATCQVALPVEHTGGTEAGIFVVDATPTTCAGSTNTNFSAAGVAALLQPAGGLTQNGYVMTWDNIRHDIVNQRDASLLEHNQRHHPNSQYHYTNTEHAAVAPIANRLPHYAIQREDSLGDGTTYWKTVSNWANNGRGNATEWTDESATGSSTYRLVAIYGADCGVVVEPGDIAPDTCVGVHETTKRDTNMVFRAMKPRRNLDESRGVIVTWKGVRSPIALSGTALDDRTPSRLVLQRSTDSGTDKNWVILGVYDSDTRGTLKYVDNTAYPGSTYHYRVVAVYDNGCGVPSRNLNSVTVNANIDNLFESLTIGGPGSSPVITLRQVFWASEYEFFRTSSGNEIPSDLIVLAHQEGKSTIQYTDTVVRRAQDTGTNPRTDVFYELRVIDFAGTRHSERVDVDNPPTKKKIGSFWFEDVE